MKKMHWQNTLMSLIVLSLMLSSTACGFHLRSPLVKGHHLTLIALSPHEPFTPYQRVLRQMLNSHKIKILTEDRIDHSALRLTLRNNAWTEQTLAYGSNNQPSIKRLEFTLEYELHNKGELIKGLTVIKTAREYSVSSSAVLQSEYETEALKQNLMMDASIQLLRQISSLAQ